MSLLLAGLTVLMIGDSHMSEKGYLITTLHDDLMKQGAKVYSFGACGTPSSAWMKAIRPPCGSAFRLDDGQVRIRASEAGFTKPLPVLVKAYHPNLIVVINGDTMAGYKDKVLPKRWIWGQVSTLTKGIKASGVSCVWVGPAWGEEGGKYGKTYARAKAMSNYLAKIVAPCTYVSSLKMSKPGEWGTIDGQHFNNSGYRSWGSAIAKQIVSSDILQKIKH
ncbi:MAG: SGNH/GDSL hydrolase family protein [Gallionella sp.]